MRLLFLSPYFFPAESYGGPIAAGLALAQGIAALGHTVRVVTSNADGRETLAARGGWVTVAPGVEVRYYRRQIGALFAPGMLAGICKEWAEADGIYVWGMFLWCLPWVLLHGLVAEKALVIAPGGMLAPVALSRKGLRKRIFLTAMRTLGLGRAVILATSSGEARDVVRLWPAAKTQVIPHGVDIPDEPSCTRTAAVPSLLYLGRLDPYKRLEQIVRAFGRALARHESREASRHGQRHGVNGKSPSELDPRTSWSIVIAGGGEPSYRLAVEREAAKVGIADRVRFAGHVTGEEKATLLANAEGLVLASYSENFGMSVAEALAHGTPCVVTKTAPWEGLDREGCGFWVDDSEEALAAGMQRLMALSAEERRAMGERGRAWMRREFSWDSVARRMLALYEELIAARKRSS